MPLRFTINEWRDIKTLANRTLHSPLGTALKAYFNNKYAALETTLDSKKTSVEDIRYAQGERNAYKHAIMVLENLIRLSESNAHARPSSGETNARQARRD